MVSNTSNVGVVASLGTTATPNRTTRNAVAPGRARQNAGRDVVTLNSTAAQPSGSGPSGQAIKDVSGARTAGRLGRQEVNARTRDVLVGTINRRAEQLIALAEQLA